MFFFSAALVILLQVKVFLFHELNTVMIKKRLLMNKIHCNVYLGLASMSGNRSYWRVGIWGSTLHHVSGKGGLTFAYIE